MQLEIFFNLYSLIMNHKLKLGFYNVRSITNKIYEVFNILNEQNIDILCLNETFLTSKINHINLLNNYTIIRNDRPTHGGGIATILNKEIKFRTILNENNSEYEVIIIEILLEKTSILLINLYTHPKSKTDFKFLEKYILHKKVIILGDLNATNQDQRQNQTPSHSNRR